MSLGVNELTPTTLSPNLKSLIPAIPVGHAFIHAETQHQLPTALAAEASGTKVVYAKLTKKDR